jgi:2-haloacid dehalogenase
MSRNRREFLNLMAGFTAASAFASSQPVWAAQGQKAEAVLFDAFPIFDPSPVFTLAEELFPGKGAELSDLWRNRQFEYTWLRALSRHYQNFWQVTEESLVFAAGTLKLDLTAERRERLMNAYLALKPWPDVPPALKSLARAGLRLGLLSNLTANMLDACIKSSGLEGQFQHVLSTDSVKTYKPDARAYQMGIDALRLKREEIVFVAFAGWDAAGAKWFGYPTFWANRRHQPAAEMGVRPDATADDLTGLMNFVRP